MFKKKPKKTTQSEIANSIAMRGLVQRLSLGPHKDAIRIIAFIAARPREGTSTMARGYAISLASQSNQKVLLIDAGHGAEERYRDYGADENGFIVDSAVSAHMPMGDAQVIGENMSGGSLVSNDFNPGAVSRVMHNRSFWKDLLDSYDTLIIDAPSLRSSFDGVAVAAKADATVIIVEAEKTPQPVIEHLRDTLAAAGAKTAGVVMNKRRFYIPKRVYKKI